MSAVSHAAIIAAESGWVPDSLITRGIKMACGNRLSAIEKQFSSLPGAAMEAFLEELERSPIAAATETANEQHYELPPAFFEAVLGPRLKYSGCEWPSDVRTLAEAEEEALNTAVTRAEIEDGASVLELGCGWGSLTLYMAQRFPNSPITAVSNSAPQREFIMNRAQKRGIKNVTVVTSDINAFEPDRNNRFDRIVSIEMLEHVRNYRALFRRIARWLSDDGSMFVHIFRHKSYPYLFETEGDGDWMGRHFFTGGVMPSHNLLADAQDSLTLSKSWEINGTHYAKTADAWLHNLDLNEGRIRSILTEHYGQSEAGIWLNRWRMFFIACRELFGYRDGTEWGVSHYIFTH